jgi:hypothetical protein
MIHPLIRLTLLIILLQSGVTAALAQVGGVPDTRFERLQRGVSITRWFWNPEGTARSEDHASTYISDAQLAEIRAVGFGHVRLPIEPTGLFNPTNPTQFDTQLLADLDQAISRMNAHDLAVIVDLHNWDDAWFDALIGNPTQVSAFADMWRALARHLSTTDPDMVFLEVLNEPSGAAVGWLDAQARFAAAIREGAPQHTIIAGGPQWNGIDGLLALTPLPDPNIVYNFHFYEPWIFTHQGAFWENDLSSVRGLPYPSSWWNGCAYLPATLNAASDLQIREYCYGTPWNDSVIDARVRQAWAWAQQHDVRLMVNEFGVMPTAPYDSRLRWLRAARTSFERYDIGWTLWGYDDVFGLDYFAFGHLDAGVLQILGMSASPD